MTGEDAAQDVADDWVTVAEAAARLGVTVPRLRRLLARPEWSKLTGTRTRTTATGTRTSVSVPVLLLPELAVALEAPLRQRDLSSMPVGGDEWIPPPSWGTPTVIHLPDEDETETGTGTGTRRGNVDSGPDASWRERALVAEARVELLAAERDRLATALEREQENTRAALAHLADSDARLASVLAATGRVQLSEAPDAPDAPGGDTSSTRSNPEFGDGAETETPSAQASWWARLFRRGGGTS